jgi:hypothetical protein
VRVRRAGHSSAIRSPALKSQTMRPEASVIAPVSRVAMKPRSAAANLVYQRARGDDWGQLETLLGEGGKYLSDSSPTRWDGSLPTRCEWIYCPSPPTLRPLCQHVQAQSVHCPTQLAYCGAWLITPWLGINHLSGSLWRPPVTSYFHDKLS